MSQTKIYQHLPALLQRVPLLTLEARSSDFFWLIPNLCLNCLGYFGSIGIELVMLNMNVVLPEASIATMLGVELCDVQEESLDSLELLHFLSLRAAIAFYVYITRLEG